jgi:hypothetical protein
MVAWALFIHDSDSDGGKPAAGRGAPTQAPSR